MAAFVYAASVDAGAQTRGAVYWAAVDTGKQATTTVTNWVYGARLDAGVPLTPMALGDVAITQSAAASVSSDLQAVQPVSGSARYVYGARVDAPFAPPPIYDFPLDPGVEIAQSASSSFTAGLSAVLGEGYAFGNVAVLQSGMQGLAADLQIYVPSVEPPTPEPPTVSAQGGVIVQRNTKTVERVEGRTTVKRIEKPYSDPALVSRVADTSYAVAALAAQVGALQGQIAAMQAVILEPKPMAPLPPELAAMMPIQTKQKAPPVEKVQAPYNPMASEQDDLAYVAGVLASMK